KQIGNKRRFIFRREIGVDLPKRENVFVGGVIWQLHSGDDDARIRIPRFYHVDDRLKIVPDLCDWHAAERVVDSELENEDVDLGFEMRGQTLQSARRRSAALARVRDFEVRQSGGAQFFGQQRRIRLSRAQPEARRQTVTENKNSFHCRRIARRGGNGWRG